MTPDTILTQMGITSCVPKIERGTSLGGFSLNKNHSNHLPKSKRTPKNTHLGPKEPNRE